MEKIDEIKALIADGAEKWSYLKQNWTKLGMPGWSGSPNEFIICSLLAQITGANGSIDDVAKKVINGKTIFQHLVSQEIIPGFIGNSELASICVAMISGKISEAEVNIPAKMADPPTERNVREKTEVKSCPFCGHDHDKCRLGFYERAQKKEEITDKDDRPADTPEFLSCGHVGQDGKCVECTEDKVVQCSDCGQEIILAKAHKCKDEDCENIYCDDCESILNENGYCEDCSEIICDSCNNEVSRGTEIRCANPNCNEDIDYCADCAGYLLNSDGLCASCSQEENFQCDDCGQEIISSKAYKCKGEDCENVYCNNCKSNLNENGYCDNCNSIECSGCGGEIDRSDGKKCSDKNCENKNIYCKYCANRLFNKDGFCPDCSGEEEACCNECGNDTIASRLKHCKGLGCSNCYCPECVGSELDGKGRCTDCRD